MNQVSFNFGAYFFNAFQEQVERIIGGPFMSAFPIEETDNYSIIRADDVIYKRIGAAYLPVMASVLIPYLQGSLFRQNGTKRRVRN